MNTYRHTQFGKVFVVVMGTAIELKMKNGKTCRIGTDEPEVLTAALQEALDSLQPAPE